MSDATLDSVGKKLTGPAQRDAVHFALAPVMAGQFLRAGQRVKFAPGTTEVVVGCEWDEEPVGIIDPFIDSYVSERDRCWLFLMPGTITGLRHEWTHPAYIQNAMVQPTKAESAKDYSERWLRGYAEKYSGTYEEMLAGAANGESAFFGEELEYGDFKPHSEFWKHVSVVTGRTFSEEHMENTRFSCSC